MGNGIYMDIRMCMPHQEEEDLAKDGVLEMELGLVVLKLDVQAILDTNLHLDCVVGLRLLGSCAWRESSGGERRAASGE